MEGFSEKEFFGLGTLRQTARQNFSPFKFTHFSTFKGGFFLWIGAFLVPKKHRVQSDLQQSIQEIWMRSGYLGGSKFDGEYDGEKIWRARR